MIERFLPKAASFSSEIKFSIRIVVLTKKKHHSDYRRLMIIYLLVTIISNWHESLSSLDTFHLSVTLHRIECHTAAMKHSG